MTSAMAYVIRMELDGMDKEYDRYVAAKFQAPRPILAHAFIYVVLTFASNILLNLTGH